MNTPCLKEDSIEQLNGIVRSHMEDKDRHVEGVKEELKTMRENHLHHIQNATESQARSQIEVERRLGEINVLSMKTSTNQEWLLKYHWIVATSSIGALITSLLGLILK